MRSPIRHTHETIIKKKILLEDDVPYSINISLYNLYMYGIIFCLRNSCYLFTAGYGHYVDSVDVCSNNIL